MDDNRDGTAKAVAVAFGTKIRDEVDKNLGNVILEWAEQGMTVDEIKGRLAAAMDASGRC
jgi:hypothetical protein